jgi:hypothetical protein
MANIKSENCNSVTIARVDRRRLVLLQTLETRDFDEMAQALPQWDLRFLQKVMGQADWDYQPLLTELARQVGSELGQDDTATRSRRMEKVACSRKRSGQPQSGYNDQPLEVALRKCDDSEHDGEQAKSHVRHVHSHRHIDRHGRVWKARGPSFGNGGGRLSNALCKCDMEGSWAFFR